MNASVGNPTEAAPRGMYDGPDRPRIVTPEWVRQYRSQPRRERAMLLTTLADWLWRYALGEREFNLTEAISERQRARYWANRPTPNLPR